MGKLVVGVARFLLFCTLLSPIWLVPTEAFAYGESISVDPSSGPAGKSVTIKGSGWYDHARLGYDVPILIGTTEVGRGHPKPNDKGEFRVDNITIPLNPPPSEIVNGKLRISAIIGNGGSADAFYIITAGQYQTRPEIVRFETFRDGVLVFFRLYFTDPSNIAAGFGFRGIKGSGWAEENHLFTSPSYGRVFPGGIIEYPFNHLCGQPGAYESDVEAWININDNTGPSPSVAIHLACSAPPAPVPATIENTLMAGYAATGSQAHPINYTKVSATWDVPVLLDSCDEGIASAAATWPGIGSSFAIGDLVQAGTVVDCFQDCVKGICLWVRDYWAFWQVYINHQAAPATRIPDLPIFPGNTVMVEVTSYGSGVFGIDIWNLTLGLYWHPPTPSGLILGDKSPEATSAAYCLQELPPNVTQLSHFSSVTITCSANNLPIGSAGDITLKAIMPKAIMPKMKTGDLNASGKGDTFTIDWVSP